MPVRWDAKNNPRGITGLHEILGRDYGIEKPYWGPASKLGRPVVQSVSRDQVQRAPLNKRVNLSSESS